MLTESRDLKGLSLRTPVAKKLWRVDLLFTIMLCQIAEMRSALLTSDVRQMHFE